VVDHVGNHDRIPIIAYAFPVLHVPAACTTWHDNDASIWFRETCGNESEITYHFDLTFLDMLFVCYVSRHKYIFRCVKNIDLEKSKTTTNLERRK
jgi:hypothetical protein